MVEECGWRGVLMVEKCGSEGRMVYYAHQLMGAKGTVIASYRIIFVLKIILVCVGK